VTIRKNHGKKAAEELPKEKDKQIEGKKSVDELSKEKDKQNKRIDGNKAAQKLPMKEDDQSEGIGPVDHLSSSEGTLRVSRDGTVTLEKDGQNPEKKLKASDAAELKLSDGDEAAENMNDADKSGAREMVEAAPGVSLAGPEGDSQEPVATRLGAFPPMPSADGTIKFACYYDKSKKDSESIAESSGSEE
jgi:hypothetical protein